MCVPSDLTQAGIAEGEGGKEVLDLEKNPTTEIMESPDTQSGES